MKLFCRHKIRTQTATVNEDFLGVLPLKLIGAGLFSTLATKTNSVCRTFYCWPFMTRKSYTICISQMFFNSMMYFCFTSKLPTHIFQRDAKKNSEEIIIFCSNCNNCSHQVLLTDIYIIFLFLFKIISYFFKLRIVIEES